MLSAQKILEEDEHYLYNAVKYDFLKMLKTDWDGLQWILQILNSNMTSELRSLCVDRDYKPKVRTRREE